LPIEGIAEAVVGLLYELLFSFAQVDVRDKVTQVAKVQEVEVLIEFLKTVEVEDSTVADVSLNSVLFVSVGDGHGYISMNVVT
jgi:hypothetical protein